MKLIQKSYLTFYCKNILNFLVKNLISINTNPLLNNEYIQIIKINIHFLNGE